MPPKLRKLFLQPQIVLIISKTTPGQLDEPESRAAAEKLLASRGLSQKDVDDTELRTSPSRAPRLLTHVTLSVTIVTVFVTKSNDLLRGRCPPAPTAAGHAILTVAWP